MIAEPVFRRDQLDVNIVGRHTGQLDVDRVGVLGRVRLRGLPDDLGKPPARFADRLQQRIQEAALTVHGNLPFTHRATSLAGLLCCLLRSLGFLPVGSCR